MTVSVCDAGEIRDFFLWHFAYLSNFRFILDGYYHDWVGHFWTAILIPSGLHRYET